MWHWGPGDRVKRGCFLCLKYAALLVAPGGRGAGAGGRAGAPAPGHATRHVHAVATAAGGAVGIEQVEYSHNNTKHSA